MKKIISLVLVLTMALALCACGGTKPDPDEDDAGLVNPWIECSAQELAAKTGHAFGVPDSACDVVYLYNESIGMAEMRYTSGNTLWSARMQKTDAFEDISGMYYDFSVSDNYGYGEEIPISDLNGERTMGRQYLLETEEGTVNLGMWYYEAEGLMLSLGCVSPDGIVLFADRNRVFFPGGPDDLAAGEPEPEETAAETAAEPEPTPTLPPMPEEIMFFIICGDSRVELNTDSEATCIRDFVQNEDKFASSPFEEYRLDNPGNGDVQVKYNGVWYLIRSDFANATLSIFCVIESEYCG